MTFDQLEFEPTRYTKDGVKARASFPNGYGASVIRSTTSCGGDQALYELAVLQDGQLCYTTPITDNVVGWLTPDDVTRLLGEIEALIRI